MARRKHNDEQPELPIDPPGPIPAQPKPPSAAAPPPAPGGGNGHGNGAGADHVIAESEAVPVKPRMVKPTNIELPLHRRVDTSFLQYASYVIRDRAIPNLADGLKPVQRRILWGLH